MGRDKPPKLPPRDNSIYATGGGLGGGKMKPDYDHMEEARFKVESRGKQSKKDDPYYCGLRARIPNFAKSKVQKEKETSRMASAAASQQAPQQQSQQPGMGVHHPMAAWHGGNTRDYESDYSHIYGRLPIPTRGFRQYPPPRGQIYVSEWE